MWTYQQVKAADAALSPPVSDPGAAASSLNAQTAPAPVQPVLVAAVHGILLLSGDWLGVEALAVSTSAPAAAVGAAKLALELAGSKVESIAPQSWPGFLNFLNGLHAAGAVSDSSLTAISALANPLVAAWNPPLTSGDVQTARTQP